MPLSKNKSYFISKPHVYLRSKSSRGDKVNHLLLGDWLRVLNTTVKNGCVNIRCRNSEGWIKKSEFSKQRALEVNFVDIGQGDGCHIVTPDDDIILIDAGVGSNMNRFLSWRYNLRHRNVKRASDFDANKKEKTPWLIDHLVISHPDNDHYYGFLDVFENLKLEVGKVYHNGIVERPAEVKKPGLTYPDDLGGYAASDGEKYLWNLVDTSKKMKDLNKAHPKTRKQYLSTMRACLKNSPTTTFKALSVDIDKLENQVFLGPFDEVNDVSLRVLGPVVEKVSHQGKTRKCLRRLGSEGVTKNGHSVILKLLYGNLSIMLGGDLNTESQDFLLQQYTSVGDETSTLEKKIKKTIAKGNKATQKELTSLAVNNFKLDVIIAEARATFECDVTKACHHGSSHFTDTFLQCVNAAATVISSGDNESHSHPRPDALGAFGKHGRGDRPMIFSTELARSTREFTPIIKHFEALQSYLKQIEESSSKQERKRLQREMEEKQDRNVAVYGMITLRALGDKVIIAQKLEQPKKGFKWDIHELAFNKNTKQFEAVEH
ncbi:MAG: MBL fold metallo-hydrolase [Kangiellaceae bacterium]|nr:MBL fold metallo-hydrolase [Kangiellaceae bacterium]